MVHLSSGHWSEPDGSRLPEIRTAISRKIKRGAFPGSLLAAASEQAPRPPSHAGADKPDYPVVIVAAVT
jgi:hypothetical protein